MTTETHTNQHIHADTQNVTHTPTHRHTVSRSFGSQGVFLFADRVSLITCLGQILLRLGSGRLSVHVSLQL